MTLRAKDRGIAHIVSGSRVRPAQHDWGKDILAPKVIAIAERAKQSAICGPMSRAPTWFSSRPDYWRSSTGSVMRRPSSTGATSISAWMVCGHIAATRLNSPSKLSAWPKLMQ